MAFRKIINSLPIVGFILGFGISKKYVRGLSEIAKQLLSSEATYEQRLILERLLDHIFLGGILLGVLFALVGAFITVYYHLHSFKKQLDQNGVTSL